MIDGDPFILLLESQMKKDKARCEAWKDEVHRSIPFDLRESGLPHHTEILI